MLFLSTFVRAIEVQENPKEKTLCLTRVSLLLYLY